MNKKKHKHNEPLPKPAHPSPKLPKNHFGELAGSLDHIAVGAHNSRKPDNNHLYLWISVATGKYAGRYECAVNTQSSDHGAPALYCEHESDVDVTDFPEIGFADDAVLSYKDLGLHDSDFVEIPKASLQPILIHLSEQATRIAAYGMTYPTGDGLHDVHLNTGNDPGSGFKDLKHGQDGAIAFYSLRNDGSARRHWLFLKFKTQHIKQS